MHLYEPGPLLDALYTPSHLIPPQSYSLRGDEDDSLREPNPKSKSEFPGQSQDFSWKLVEEGSERH